jgi:hypothetical protein
MVPLGQRNGHGARRVWHVFLQSWYEFGWAIRVSRYRFGKWPRGCPGAGSIKKSTGAVSRYLLSRSQKTIKVQDINCWQMRESGFITDYKIALDAGAVCKNHDKPYLL